jgi:GxxExxY protein
MEEERFTAESAEERREAQRENRAGDLVIAACLKVHTALGPGLLESAYEACLAHELIARGLRVDRQLLLPIRYDGITLDAGYRIDLLVDECVVVELKAIDAVLPVHVAQVISYLKLGRFKLGYLLNFNVVRMRDGIKRLVNGL